MVQYLRVSAGNEVLQVSRLAFFKILPIWWDSGGGQGSGVDISTGFLTSFFPPVSPLVVGYQNK